MKTLFGNTQYALCLRPPRPYFNRIEWFNGQLDGFYIGCILKRLVSDLSMVFLIN
jgi:hypothetical protein